MLSTALVSVDQAASPAGADQNCLGWERELRSAAGFDDLGRPTIDRLDGDRPFGQVLRDWVADDCLRVNYVQVLGTHNSYHIEPRLLLLQFIATLNPEAAASIEYTHRPLGEQLEILGIRQLELDVYVDPDPGRFALPLGQLVFPANPPQPDPVKLPLLGPGLKVLHVPDVDFETRCLTFVACLQQLEDWSDANPGHLPVMVQVEAKDDAAIIPPGVLPPGLPDPVTPVPFGPSELDGLDAEIRSVFGEHQLITPDLVRGDRATLEEAVLIDGWPTLNETRGRFLFTLDNEGTERDLYIAGHPSLEGRVMFTSSPPGTPEAAFVKLNDPVADGELIKSLVAAGYIVRTRADADTVEARFGLTVRRDAALASGAQFVSTDYPEADPAFGTGYLVDLPGGDVARCNPVLSPPGCDPSTLEG
ncbi:MAG: phosphatidylinositol-specific phospholipase C1-like protein [Acidimicrobiia bacterium]|nr:phosphatidylinositol-specific phospholipase C1-like protein [Acidimicrobiia bacterium]